MRDRLLMLKAIRTRTRRSLKLTKDKNADELMKFKQFK